MEFSRGNGLDGNEDRTSKKVKYPESQKYNTSCLLPLGFGLLVSKKFHGKSEFVIYY